MIRRMKTFSFVVAKVVLFCRIALSISADLGGIGIGGVAAYYVIGLTAAQDGTSTTLTPESWRWQGYLVFWKFHLILQ